jgi:hypothetical protein
MRVWFGWRPGWRVAGLAVGLALAPPVWGEGTTDAGAAPPAPPASSTEKSDADQPQPSEVAEALKLAQAPEAAAPSSSEAPAGGLGSIRWSGSGELLGWTTLNGSMKQGIFARNNANSDFVATHFHLKATAPMGLRALFYGELCITHPRVGPQPEQVYFEYARSEKLNFQAGRFLMPFGQWNTIHDVFDHKSIAYPLMYLGHEEEELALEGGPRPIVSTGFSDIGILAYGSVWPGENDQIWYGAYVCNGRFGGTDIEWLDLWNTVRDNNSDKAYGGRVVWSHGDNLTIGGSYQTGRFDIENKLRYRFAGVDLYYRISNKVNLRAEYLRNPVDSFIQGYTKEGWYISADMPVGKKHEVVVMHSHLSQDPAQRVENFSRTTVGFNTFLNRNLKVKTELEYLNLGRFVGDPNNASDAQFGTSFRDTTRLRASLVGIF